MYLFAIEPVWSSLINVGKTFFILSAVHDVAILYTTFNNEIGLQFF